MSDDIKLASDQSRSDFKRMSDDDTPALHIYPQDGWHADAWIVGNQVGLTALRDAINRVLEKNRATICHVTPCDGEFYRLVVGVLTDDQIQELHVPYYEQSPWIEKGKGPYEMVGSAFSVEIEEEEAAKRD